MTGLKFLRRGNRFAARVRRSYFSAEKRQPEIRLCSQATRDHTGNFFL